MPKKQAELPGVERTSIPAIEIAAQNYVSVRDKRMALTEKEIAAKTALVQAMQAHEDQLSVNGEGDRIYKFDDEVCILSPGKVNVKVRAAHDDIEPEDED